jgi:hypothetical protein
MEAERWCSETLKELKMAEAAYAAGYIFICIHIYTYIHTYNIHICVLKMAEAAYAAGFIYIYMHACIHTYIQHTYMCVLKMAEAAYAQKLMYVFYIYTYIHVCGT